MSFAHAYLFAMTICKARLSQKCVVVGAAWAYGGRGESATWVFGGGRGRGTMMITLDTPQTILCCTSPAWPSHPLGRPPPPPTCRCHSCCCRSLFASPPPSPSGLRQQQESCVCRGRREVRGRGESSGGGVREGEAGRGSGRGVVSVHHISQTPC